MEKEQHELYEKARKRVKQKKRLYYHFIIFLIGSLFLIVLNTFFNVGQEKYGEWFKYAVALWLLIWIFHFINVFITNKFFGKEWERIETEKLIKKHNMKSEKLEKKIIKSGVLTSIDEPLSSTKKKITKNSVTIIAAIGKHRELGKNNKLLWHLPNDLKRFKKITSGHDVIMGRKTYESLGGPLPSRTNIIISRNRNYMAPLCTVVHSLEDALIASEDPDPYILGGAQIYTEAIKIADKLDLTLVDASFDADAFFPEINNKIWKETSREKHYADEKHDYDYSFVTFKRK
ncbi:dihydrofolate reductase [Aureibaculum sp. 2210JD6-5]|uniref:dihydrofolate reductase n=1 Tax=Aureibaculum sp. 2210JD6-5 TaxID=3103957 RepID=UPI002AAD0E6D|nr:dihydrofolate reductase [Aureibaculum sp. 2210JD6-5]MDY7396275.1 dihydrofolate reductase [Aureibaculum sp. 2210JD6-5]